MKVHLNNYQIHSDSIFEINGLTGVIGSNNNGKTSLIRSLRDFVKNEFTSDKIKQGAKIGYIDIDGIKLERNSKTSILHLLDGTVIEKMSGQKLPKFPLNRKT